MLKGMYNCRFTERMQGCRLLLPSALAVWPVFMSVVALERPPTCPESVVFPTVDALNRHPTQLYESAFHLTAAAGDKKGERQNRKYQPRSASK